MIGCHYEKIWSKVLLIIQFCIQMECHLELTLWPESIDNSSYKICFSSTQSVSITTNVTNDIIGLITQSFHPFGHRIALATIIRLFQQVIELQTTSIRLWLNKCSKQHLIRHEAVKFEPNYVHNDLQTSRTVSVLRFTKRTTWYCIKVSIQH